VCCIHNVTGLQNHVVAKTKSKRPAKLHDVLALVRSNIELGTYRDTRHAAQRKEERSTTLLEILHVLKRGHHEKRKDEFKLEYGDWNYAIRGKTVDQRELRVVVTFVSEMLVITAIDLNLKD
jgi:hypothetical protein